MATKENRLMKLLRILFVITSIVTLVKSTVAQPIAITAKPIPLNTSDPSNERVGNLIYLGGLEITSNAPEFGGFSSLGVSADGKRMVTISDVGRRLAANLRYDLKGRLIGLEMAELDSLSDTMGHPLSTKKYSDAEAMSPGVKGEIIIAFERDHRLWRYLPNEIIPLPMNSPIELATLPANSGIEALTLLDDGSLIAISEGSKGTEDAIAWISDRQGWSVMTYASTQGFRASGAATIPDGNILVLERRYTLRDGVAIRIMQLEPRSIKPGAHLVPKLLAELRRPLNVENFEGIEALRDESGKIIIYIVSDNNFNPMQRNLLMMFELIR